MTDLLTRRNSQKMSDPTNSNISPKKKTKYFNHRAKTCRPSQTERKKKFYFTDGRPIADSGIKELEDLIFKPYKLPHDLQSIEGVKRFWNDEKNRKIKEREKNCTEHHNYQSRLNLLWKRERLFVPEEITLPGKSLTENIDPDFFTIVSGRPIKEKTNIRQYLKDIRECFLTRLKTGYHLDEILLMDERHINEKKRLEEITKNFLSCLKSFEMFLKEDHVLSSSLLETAKGETKKSKNKLEIINGLRDELKKLQADVLLVEEQWRNCKMFQKFLYIISPSEWRKVYDPYYGKEDVGVIASDPCLFDSFREFPGVTKIDLDAKISKFKNDIKTGLPPELYFTDPQQLQNILMDLEKNNLIALAHCKELDFPAEKMQAELEKAKISFKRDQTILEEEIKYLTDLVEKEEEKGKADEEKLKEVAFGLFRDLITNEEYLSVMSYVEDAYEDAVSPNDGNLDLVTMFKEIELKHESLLLALDILPNDIMVRTTRNFYKRQKREFKEAREAEKKVHQMDMLLKRFSKSLELPKKGVKERRIVRRSSPPEELMFTFEQPKLLSKEEKDYLFFFGKTETVKLHKPLCT